MMKDGKPKVNGCAWWCPWCANWVHKDYVTPKEPITNVRYHDLKQGGCGEVVARRKRIQ